MVKEVRIPDPGAGAAASFQKFERTYADLPLVNVAVRVNLDAAGKVSEARVVIGAATAVPERSSAAESALIGNLLSDEVIAAAAAATSEVDCITDIRATAELRALWVRCGVEDALKIIAAK